MFDDIFDSDYLKKLNRQNQSDTLYTETGEGLDGTLIDARSHRTAGNGVPAAGRADGGSRPVRTTGPDAGKFIDSQGYYREHDTVSDRNGRENNAWGATVSDNRKTADTAKLSETVAAVAKPIKANAEKFIDDMGLVDASDNVHAQRDDRGQSYGRPLTETVNQGLKHAGEVISKQAAYGMTLNANEHLARAENPLGDILKDYIENGLGKSGAQHEDESAYLLMNKAFSGMAHPAVARTLTTPVYTDRVNGREKLDLTKDAFTNEFFDRPPATLYSLGSMAGDTVSNILPAGSIDKTGLNAVEKKRAYYQQRLDDYDKKAMSLGKIVDMNDPERTVNNVSQYYYEWVGSKAPYIPLMMINPVIGAMAPQEVRMGTNFMIGMADYYSRKRQQTGENDYVGAVTSGMLHAAVREMPYLRNLADPAGQKTWADFVTRLMALGLDGLIQQWLRDTESDEKKQREMNENQQR